MKLEVEFFKALYLRARLSYSECVLNPDNDYLQDEIDTPIDEIILKEDAICLQFSEHEIDRFTVEVKLQLTSADNHLIGNYFYYEDEKEIPLDDRLIFDYPL
ncbi:hypothetical protein [Pedobacter gandavensis]|uniref:hypothetical protein n=1 Tax=Pedobacter gandavensis TaxID=2679963 RepID=UPI002930832B|nr:hypothetical protein [Pedobacter gandavensis]